MPVSEKNWTENVLWWTWSSPGNYSCLVIPPNRRQPASEVSHVGDGWWLQALRKATKIDDITEWSGYTVAENFKNFTARPVIHWARPGFNIQILDSARSGPLQAKPSSARHSGTFEIQENHGIGRRLILLPNLVPVRHALFVPCLTVECSVDRPSACTSSSQGTEQLIGQVVSAASHIIKLSF